MIDFLRLPNILNSKTKREYLTNSDKQILNLGFILFITLILFIDVYFKMILINNKTVVQKIDEMSLFVIVAFCFVTGSVSWGGDCSIGRRQSPIDLAKAASVTGRYPPLFFRNYDSVLENAKIRNTGHSCK